MKVFVTGATGFVGSAVTRELIAAGHQVLGLARDEGKAGALAAAGAEVLMGSMEDAGLLARGVAASDGVIHCAFDHDFSRFKENCEKDRRVIGALGAALAGTGKLMLITSGTGLASGLGRPVQESDPQPSSDVMPRAASEEAAAAARAAGALVSVVRLPQVHDRQRQGLVSFAIQVARQKGVSAYLGDGLNRWPAAPVADVARLYRLALEKGASGAVYNAVAEEGVRVRDLAEVLGKRLGLPVASIPVEEAAAHFGFLAPFAAGDLTASSARTRAALGWQPAGPGLLEDLAGLELEG